MPWRGSGRGSRHEHSAATPNSDLERLLDEDGGEFGAIYRRLTRARAAAPPRSRRPRECRACRAWRSRAACAALDARNRLGRRRRARRRHRLAGWQADRITRRTSRADALERSASVGDRGAADQRTGAHRRKPSLTSRCCDERSGETGRSSTDVEAAEAGARGRQKAATPQPPPAPAAAPAAAAPRQQ